MPYTFGRIKIENLEKLKSNFNNPEAINKRKASGAKSWKMFCVDGKPDEVAVLMEWDSLDGARKFLESKELREAQSKAGVIETSEEYFLEEV